MVAPLDTPPLFGFRVGEIAQFHHGWGGRPATVRVVGPGSRATSLAVDPLDLTPQWPPRETDVDAWDLMHDTPAFRIWVDLWEQSLHSTAIRDRDEHVAALRRATEVLITENPQLLIGRATGEGGPPHSWAVCHQASLIEMEARSVAQLERAIQTINDPEILDHLRWSAARMAEMNEMQAPWLEDADRVILRRIASHRR
jgi:hypothetical protein